jgi:hypothetical protein
MNRIRALLIVAVLSLVTACQPAGSDLPPAELPLTLQTTGGVSGANTTLTVDAAGAWTFTNQKNAAKNRTGQLSGGELSTLRGLLADRGVVNAPAKKNQECADYFRYTLTAVHRAVRTGECGETAPAVEKLITYLRQVTTNG